MQNQDTTPDLSKPLIIRAPGYDDTSVAACDREDYAEMLEHRTWTLQKINRLRRHQQLLDDIISHGITYAETIDKGDGQPPITKTKENPMPCIRAINTSLRIERMIEELEEDLWVLGGYLQPGELDEASCLGEAGQYSVEERGQKKGHKAAALPKSKATAAQKQTDRSAASCTPAARRPFSLKAYRSGSPPGKKHSSFKASTEKRDFQPFTGFVIK